MPIISVEDTYLYERFNGKLLIVVAFDADNEIFPLSYALVEEENNINWRWLLLFTQHHIIGDRSGICIISDKHTRIKHGMIEIWPRPIEYHWYCVRHLVSKFNHKFKDLSTKKELLRMCYEASKRKL
jgi:hypothetical protein